MSDRFIVPLKGEPYTSTPLPPEVRSLFRQWRDLEDQIRDTLMHMMPPFLWLPLDTTAEDIARMEGEGGVPC